MLVSKCSDSKPATKPTPAFMTYNDILKQEGVYRWHHTDGPNKQSVLVVIKGVDKQAVLYYDGKHLEPADESWKRMKFMREDSTICFEIKENN